MLLLGFLAGSLFFVGVVDKRNSPPSLNTCNRAHFSHGRCSPIDTHPSRNPCAEANNSRQ